MTDRVLKLDEVSQMTGKGKTAIYRDMAECLFPQAIQLTGGDGRAVGWRLSEIQEWIATRPRVEQATSGEDVNASGTASAQEASGSGEPMAKSLRPAKPVRVVGARQRSELEMLSDKVGRLLKKGAT